MRSSCSRGFRSDTTACVAAELRSGPALEEGDGRRGAGRPGDRVLDVATGTGMVACDWPNATAVRSSGSIRASRCSPERARSSRRSRAWRSALSSSRGGRAPALRRWRVRRAHLHLPAALRRGPRRDAARAGAGGEARRHGSPLWSSPCRAHGWRALSGCSIRGSVCRALGRLVSRDWYEVGRFLGPSISGFYRRYPPAAVAELWRRAGIDSVVARDMSLGGGVVMWGVREDGGVARA